jgi:Flp pilus assembly secretin CpaC
MKIFMVGVIMSKSIKFAASLFAVLVAFPSFSHAEQVRVMLDRTQLITMSVQPATVVIGNPAIADANISGNQVFINGYSPGTTNIIMLDASGASLANLEVVVTRASTETAAVFRSGGRQSLVCPDYCDPTVEIGDAATNFEAVSSQAQAKRAAALGIIGENKDNAGPTGGNGASNSNASGEGSGNPQ